MISAIFGLYSDCGGNEFYIKKNENIYSDPWLLAQYLELAQGSTIA
jgi:hypothetical protein